MVLVAALARFAPAGGPSRLAVRATAAAAAASARPPVAPTKVAAGPSAIAPAAAATPAAPLIAPPAAGPIPAAPTPDGQALLVSEEPPPRDMVELAVRMGRTTNPPRLQLASRAPPRAVGDHERFWVHDIVAERYFEVDAVLEAVSANAYFWVQTGHDFDRAELDRGAREFSDRVVPELRGVYGLEWNPGVDLDERMHVLHHQPIRGVAGYYSSTDEYTSEVEPYSNQREMFYVNIEVYEPGSYDWLALLSHEFQHMIHWYADQNESVWANEGLSELASALAGYPSSSASLFFRDTGTPLLEWNEDPGRNGEDYAASLAFFTYVLTRFGENTIRAVVAAEPNGPAGVEAGLRAAGHAETFDDVFLDWVVANAVDDPAFAGGRFSYRDRPLEQVEPNNVTMAASNARVAPYATDYYDATDLISLDGSLALGFAGDQAVGLLEDTPAETGAVWWSGRGDGADSRLTRDFDLSATGSPRLRFKLWHQLEPNWDYAYYLASVDGGATWRRLASSRTTDADPNGNNYGAGLTGRSGGWVDEELDLTPLAGEVARLRFEVITDDAVSLSGLALDDIHLDELGFADGAEDPSGGWVAEGFRRTAPWVAGRWVVQAIVSDGGRIVRLERPAVNTDGRATIHLAGIPAGARVTLAVSNLTRGTRQPGAYRLAPPGE